MSAKARDWIPSTTLPIIDDRVEYRGVSILRTLTSKALKDLDKIIVLQSEGGDDRLAVLIPYEVYLKIQNSGATE